MAKEYGKYNSCLVCKQNLSGRGPSYRCALHKSCLEPPYEMQRHHLHSEHTLEIDIIQHPIECHVCGESFEGIAYVCSRCYFSLHQKCALLPLTKKAESHDHPLSLLRRSLSFTCDTCGIQSKSMSYFCMTYSFMVHTDCALFPLTLKKTPHEHPLSLNLKYSPQLNQYENQQICHLCIRKVDTKYNAYYCSSCDFVAHPRCAAKMNIRDETSDPKLEEDLPIETLAQIVNKITPGNGKAETVTEIKHIWHEHNLKLADKPENNEKCDACERYLISSLYYRCLQCKFFLHKSCADLPRKMLHLLHEHPLALCQEKAEFFVCKACGRRSHGPGYICESCQWHIDAPCSLLPSKFIHESHERPLFLLREEDVFAGRERTCTPCGKAIRAYEPKAVCADCEFCLDLHCATLERDIKYGPNEQTFKLCYSIVDDDESGEYYCDICEKERDPKHWFYYCADILLAAHTRCIDDPHGISEYWFFRSLTQEGKSE